MNSPDDRSARLAELSADRRKELTEEAARLMSRRAAPGPLMHLALATVFFLAAPFVSPGSWWPSVLLAAFVVFAVPRGLLQLLGARLRRRSVRAWRVAFGAAIVTSGAIWGGATAAGIVAEGVTVMLAAALFCVGAVIANTANVLAPEARLAQLHALATALPPLGATLLHGTAADWLFAAILALGLTFHLVTAGRRHREYWDAALTRALREQGERHRAWLAAIVEQGQDATAICGVDGRIRYANPAFERLCVAPEDGVLGRRPLEAWDVERGPAETELERVSSGGSWNGEVVLRTGAGERRHLHVHVAPVPQGEGPPLCVWIARDVTEVHRLQSRLAFADRMSTVGTLAAGVAHEINNPAAFVALNVAELERRLPSAEPARSLLREVADGTRRIQETVRQLLVFSRGGGESTGVVDLRAVLRAALAMAGPELRYRAQVEQDFDPDLPLPVRGSEGRLVQVFVNLLVNAAQAIDTRPGLVETVTVRARREPDGTVVAEVADTGPGIPPEHLERIFEPFFTTKAVGSGTGLGLANTHAIVTAFGGEIRARNREEGGALFEVRLPGASVRELRSDSEASLAAEPTGLRRRVEGARVLVVDDELAIGRALRRALPEHEVTVVGSGREAIERWSTRAYDVMLCDLMMPDVTGMDVYRILAATEGAEPERIVFMTGGVFTAEAQELLEWADNPCLDKPLDMDEVRRVIRERSQGRLEPARPRAPTAEWP